MHGLLVEHRYPSGNLSVELARELRELSLQGKAAVVTDKPAALLSSTKKQWAKLTRRAQRDRSSTLNAITVAELTQQIAGMQALIFSAKQPNDLLEADITFATAEDFVRFPPICPIVFVTYKFDKEKLYMLTSWLPKGGKVIIYE